MDQKDAQEIMSTNDKVEGPIKQERQVSTFHATEEYIQEPDIKINNAQEGKDDVPDTNLLENKVDIKLDINEDDIDSKTQLKNTKSQDLIAFVRESCKANLDVQVPLTWQPEDRIQTIIDSCIQEFPGYCGQELARKRIGAFLKNCRKTEKRKTTPRVRKEINKKKVKPAPPVEKPSSPWAVVSLRVFLHYNCPCCDFKCKSESNFMDHACEYHPESVDYLYCLDLDQDDEEVHDNFQDDFGDYDEVEFPWNANAIVDIKEEDRELNFNQMVDEAEDDADKDQKQKVEPGDIEPKPAKAPPASTSSTGEKVKCKQCPEEFTNKFWLSKHMNSIHGIHMDHKCTDCNSSFQTPNGLKTHVNKVHTDRPRHPCSMCKKTFPDKYKLERHVEGVHENLRNYVCDRCPKTFSVHAQLKRHVDQVHEGIRRHHCDICQRGFFEAQELRSHKLVVHENVKEWHCDQCPRSFGYKRELQKHVAQRHETHQFKCDQCDRTFPFSYILNRHVVQVHQGLKRHPCDRCEKTFITPAHLKRHVVSIHENVKSEVCHICQKGFAVKYNLVAHIKKVHKISDPSAGAEAPKMPLAPSMDSLHAIQPQSSTSDVGKR